MTAVLRAPSVPTLPPIRCRGMEVLGSGEVLASRPPKPPRAEGRSSPALRTAAQLSLRTGASGDSFSASSGSAARSQSQGLASTPPPSSQLRQPRSASADPGRPRVPAQRRCANASEAEGGAGKPRAAAGSQGAAVRSHSSHGGKKLYVAQFGNNSALVRQIMKNRPGWAAGPGDPGNSVGKTSYEDRKVKVTPTDDLPDIHFLWTQFKVPAFFDVMAEQQTGVCITSNDENKLQMKVRKAKSGKSLAPVMRMHNHFEGNGWLAKKCGLCDAIKALYFSQGRDPFSIIPMTFVMRSSRDESSAAWKRAYDALESEHGQKVWLVKPGEWANRGCGIRIYDNADEILERVDSKEKVWVVQKYMESPLLIHKRKFDIRAYCLVTQEPGGGAIRAYSYNDQYIRTTSVEYTMKSFDRMIHLNNDAVQKHGDDYGKFEAANKMSFVDLQKYLDKYHAKDRVNVQEHILHQMRCMKADAIRAAAGRLNPRRLDGCFEVYGFDFMVDASYRVWLIEVNTNPCLELCCTYLSKLIPQMLEEAMQMTVDQFFPGAASPALGRKGRERNGWGEPIYCSEGDSGEISCDWAARLPEGEEPDFASLGRDFVAPRPWKAKAAAKAAEADAEEPGGSRRKRPSAKAGRAAA